MTVVDGVDTLTIVNLSTSQGYIISASKMWYVTTFVFAISCEFYMYQRVENLYFLFSIVP